MYILVFNPRGNEDDLSRKIEDDVDLFATHLVFDDINTYFHSTLASAIALKKKMEHMYPEISYKIVDLG